MFLDDRGIGENFSLLYKFKNAVGLTHPTIQNDSRALFLE
jgi:hypothetical protein